MYLHRLFSISSLWNKENNALDMYLRIRSVRIVIFASPHKKKLEDMYCISMVKQNLYLLSS